MLLALIGCGGRSSLAPQPILLSVAISNTTVILPPNGMAVGVPVTIMAPTETTTFSILGLPGGVTGTYQASESNPSGLLTLVANSSTKSGTYMPKITVGTSGQTASLIFTLIISSPTKASSSCTDDVPHFESACISRRAGTTG
jgi:hypothetical protein